VNGVRVPASTSNLGAGFDCLGLALDLWLDARLVAGSGPPVYSGTMAVVDPTNDIVHRFTGDLTERNLHLEVHSDIPIAKGLGSSAAAVVAGITLRSLARGEPPSAEAVYREAVAAEGHPDNTGPAVYGGLVLSAHRPERLGFSDDLAVALAIPEQAIDTRAARAILPSDLPRDTAIAQAASAAALLLGLTSGNGDLIAFGMDDHIAAPVRKNLIPGYDDAVHAGREAGACGVTISGSGSTLVAIGPRSSVSDVAQAMAAALSSAGNRSQPCTPRVSERGMEVRRET
jgi:homoserine kinase